MKILREILDDTKRIQNDWKKQQEYEFKESNKSHEDDSYTDLSYLYDEPIKEPISDVEPSVEEVIEPVHNNPHRL